MGEDKSPRAGRYDGPMPDGVRLAWWEQWGDSRRVRFLFEEGATAEQMVQAARAIGAWLKQQRQRREEEMPTAPE